MAKSKTKINYRFYISLAITILVGGFLFFNEYGILEYLKVKSQINSLDKRINRANKQIDSLTKETDSLKSDKKKIEELAREKYYMHKKNERGIEVIIEN